MNHSSSSFLRPCFRAAAGPSLTPSCFASTSAACLRRPISYRIPPSPRSVYPAFARRHASTDPPPPTSKVPPASSFPQSAASAPMGAGFTEAQKAQQRLVQEQIRLNNEAKSRRSISNGFYYMAATFIVMVGASYAAVPVYRAFCGATGFAGIPITSNSRMQAERLVPTDSERRIKVHFNAAKSDSLPWTFKPAQPNVTVRPGETALAFYTAKNETDGDIIGISTYNVTPSKAAAYFAKVECFCFEEQKILANEEVDLPVFFFIDRDFLEDPKMDDVDDVVLNYTFFRAKRDARGFQVPDAPRDVVEAASGFAEFELAVKEGDDWAQVGAK